MNKIQEIIEAECYDLKPLDPQSSYLLKKEDVPVIVENIKKALIAEIRNKPHTWEDAVEAIQEL